MARRDMCDICALAPASAPALQYPMLGGSSRGGSFRVPPGQDPIGIEDLPCRVPGQAQAVVPSRGHRHL